MSTPRLTLDRLLRLVDATIENTDSRLDGHSEQVAYVVYKIAQELGIKDKNKLKVLCKTAFLHDVGCYRTATSEHLTKYETSNPHAHAAYGYAFLNFFYSEDIDIELIKWHHVSWSTIEKYPETIPELACLIHLADSFTLSIAAGNSDSFVAKASGTAFCPKHVDALLRINAEQRISKCIKSGFYKAEIRTFFSKFILTDEEALNFTSMMAYALEFHSNVTVLHSIIVTGIAQQLSELFAMTDNEKRNITIAASLHDIGKLVIPSNILEKTTKLTHDEFEIIKYHSIAGYEILSILCSDTIRDIATLHHETLDGSGYPFGLKADKLSFSCRLLAVADIGAALLSKRSYKEALPVKEVCSILQNMAHSGKIDRKIVNMFCDNIEAIFNAVITNEAHSRKIYESLVAAHQKELDHILELDLVS